MFDPTIDPVVRRCAHVILNGTYEDQDRAWEALMADYPARDVVSMWIQAGLLAEREQEKYS